MHWGSKAFVFVVFSILAASFWATTAMLYIEFAGETEKNVFNGALWFTLLTHYSDLFIFFPLFGTVALIAFFIPASAFVDMYWNISRQQDDPIQNSRLRFVLWFLFLCALSFFISYNIQGGSERSLWQLTPTAISGDKGEGCGENDCARVSFRDGLENIRRLSRTRGTITDLSRVCQPDNFISPPKTPPRTRYCAASTNFQGKGGDLQGRWQSDGVCCLAQQNFDAAVKASFEEPGNRSRTHELQTHLWPLNIFFLLILLAISVLLALRRLRIEKFYADDSQTIDRGVIVGVLAMAFLVIMNRGFLEATQLLHGVKGAASLHRGPDTFMVLFSIWALLILFSFVHPANKQAELTSRFLGVAFSILFVFNADTITNYGLRYLGAGAGLRSVIGLGGIALLLVALLIFIPRLQLTAGDKDEGKGSGDNNDGPRPMTDGPRERIG